MEDTVNSRSSIGDDSLSVLLYYQDLGINETKEGLLLYVNAKKKE